MIFWKIWILFLVMSALHIYLTTKPYSIFYSILFYCNALTQDKLYCYISKHLKTFKSIDLPLMILRFLVAMTHHTVEPISQFKRPHLAQSKRNGDTIKIFFLFCHFPASFNISFNLSCLWLRQDATAQNSDLVPSIYTGEFYAVR